MHEVKQHLLNRLETASELVLRSEPELCVGASRELAINALSRIRGQLAVTGPVDEVKARILFAPKGLLHEISIDNDWGYQFLELARDVDRLLTQLKDQA